MRDLPATQSTLSGRGHATVTHAPGRREWARDDDGDGIRKVHDNTLERLWAALRTFVRPFREIRKHDLHQYVAVFQWRTTRGRHGPHPTWAAPAHPDGLMSQSHLFLVVFD